MVPTCRGYKAVAKKYTRKQLKQPDEFITFSMKVWGILRQNVPKVLITVISAAIIIAVVWTWTYLAEAKAAKTTGMLSKAFDVYNQPLLPKDIKTPPASKDDPPRFKTQKAKLAAAEKKFDEAIKKAGGDLKIMTILVRAGVRLQEGNYQKAIEDYQTFLSKSPAGGKLNDSFRILANEGLGYSYEALKDYDKALSYFKQLSQFEGQKWVVKYHEARLLALKGKKAEAAKVLQEVTEKAGNRYVENLASNYLAQLE